MLRSIAKRGRSGFARRVTQRAQSTATGKIVLPPLPYEKAALEPWISSATVETHYGKHHAGYVTKLNPQLGPDDSGNVVELMHKFKKTKEQGKFNLAAQIWNHTFYWNSMKPGGGGPATGTIAAYIERDFGTYNTFKDQFTNSASTLFGSGWTWLVKDESGKLHIIGTSNAECPIISGQKPLLVCDVWEHAYYIDRRHDRAKYIEAWWNLVNWKFANDNYLAK